MGEILVNGEGKCEDATLVHALIRLDRQGEVEDIIRVGKGHFHCTAEGEFLKVYLFIVEEVIWISNSGQTSGKGISKQPLPYFQIPV